MPQQLRDFTKGGDAVSQQTDGWQRGLRTCIANGDALSVDGQAGGYAIGASLVIDGPVSILGPGYTGHGARLLADTPEVLTAADLPKLAGGILVAQGLGPGQALFEIQTDARVELSRLMLLDLTGQADGLHLAPSTPDRTNCGSKVADVCFYGFANSASFTNCTALAIRRPHSIMHQTRGFVFRGVGNTQNYLQGGDWDWNGGFFHSGALAPISHVLIEGTAGAIYGRCKFQPCGYSQPGNGIELNPAAGCGLEPLTIGSGVSVEGCDKCIFLNPAGGGTVSQLNIGGGVQLWGNTPFACFQNGSYWVNDVDIAGVVMISQNHNPVMLLDGLKDVLIADCTLGSRDGVSCKGFQTGPLLEDFRIRWDLCLCLPGVTP
jgi:hypothetical protein